MDGFLIPSQFCRTNCGKKIKFYTSESFSLRKYFSNRCLSKNLNKVIEMFYSKYSFYRNLTIDNIVSKHLL